MWRAADVRNTGANQEKGRQEKTETGNNSREREVEPEKRESLEQSRRGNMQTRRVQKQKQQNAGATQKNLGNSRTLRGRLL